MKTNIFLLMAIALMTISCSKDDGNSGGGEQKTPTISAEEFASLTPETLPDYDTWTITGDVTITSEELGTMMSEIDEALGDREISLVFADETDLSFFESDKPSSGWPITRLNDNIVSISAENVTILNDWVFACCHSVKSFDLPNLQSSPSSSFYYCLGITSMTLPSLTYLKGTFFQCRNLEYVDLPVATYIGQWTFAWNYALTTLKLTSPDIITFYSSAFDNFANIENCTLYLHYNNSYLEDTSALMNTPTDSEEQITFREIIYVNSDGEVTDKNGNVL
ncbi:MAG: leucine-rich repeat protein [Rikenellaceae bacterium]